MTATLIIAEAGVNHNGSLATARALIDAAAEAGADLVKFQSFQADALVTAKADKADYQRENTGSGGSQAEMLRALEIDAVGHHALAEHCRARGIGFFSTAFDFASLELLAAMELPFVKVPSGDISFGPMLLRMARLGKPVLLSTGMSDLADIEAALAVLAFGFTRDGEPAGRSDLEAAYASEEGKAALQRQVTILHCVTEYPCPPEDVNLRAMDAIAEAFGLAVGYSDHSLGIAVPIAAVARGARVIEKHLTLDRTMPGPDHAASLEPDEFKAMVAGIRAVERALGVREKRPNEAEMSNRTVARRSLVAARPIRRGETITAEMIACKRPAVGLSPLGYWDLLGRQAGRDYAADEALDG